MLGPLLFLNRFRNMKEPIAGQEDTFRSKTHRSSGVNKKVKEKRFGRTEYGRIGDRNCSVKYRQYYKRD